MAIYYKNKIDIHTLLGVWKIEETEQELINDLNLNKQDKVILNTLSHAKRRLEWLAARVLLRKLLKELDPAINLNIPLKLYINKAGKPTLQNSNCHFSLSHSDKMASAIVSKCTPVGIDIEKMQPKIGKISHKFMNEKEFEIVNNYSDKNKMLYIHWCAKEAAYKLIGKKGLSFSKDIILEDIDYPKKYQLTVSINHSGSLKKLTGFYKIINRYMLVYLC